MSNKLIQISDIEDRERRFRFDDPLNLVRGDGVTVVRLGLEGRVSRTSHGIRLEAKLRAECRLVCARCLEPFASTVSERVELTVVAEEPEVGAGEFEVGPEEASVLRAEDGRVDLVEVALEQVDLALPMKPLCASGCRGLCPTCGVNRNSLECACPERVPDPRLAPLSALKKGAGER